MKILLVDDEDDIRKVGKLSLEAIGAYDTSAVASAREALAQAKHTPPDLILLDMMMPGMDGLSALAELKADPALAGIPVIFMTAKVQRAEVERYLQRGAIGVIQKPFDPLELPKEIAAILARQQGATRGVGEKS